MLYYTRYKDCGSGVLEVLYGFHNFGSESDSSDYVDFLDAPWGSVRQSVLGDVLHAKKRDAKGNNNGSTLIYPLPSFGSPVYSLSRDLGGYTIFAQNLPKPAPTPFQNPCANSAGAIIACTNKTTQVQHFMFSDNACVYSPSHTVTYGKYTVYCWILPTVATSNNDIDCSHVRIPQMISIQKFWIENIHCSPKRRSVSLCIYCTHCDTIFRYGERRTQYWCSFRIHPNIEIWRLSKAVLQFYYYYYFLNYFFATTKISLINFVNSTKSKTYQ
jgi:hypothetical protein